MGVAGEAKEKIEEALEKAKAEAEKAGAEACRDLLSALAERPWLLEPLAETLPGLVEAFASYYADVYEYLENEEARKDIMESLPGSLASFLSSVYGVDVGVPLALILLLPASVIVDGLSKCGSGEARPPRSEGEARLRASIAVSQTTLYRLYFDLISNSEGIPPIAGEGNLII